jgi:glycosyltransferase involved in cell wall biosynthesis
VMLYLEALAILRRDYGRRLRLTVAGDGELRPVAERYAEAQGLWARFLGTVPDPDPLFAEAHFAFVSGYLAMWQALAHRRLVFAVYDNDLKRDYLQGFPEAQDSLIIADGPAQLASELNRYLGDPSLGDRMRERGARLAGDHSWERVADLYVAMYRAHGII